MLRASQAFSQVAPVPDFSLGYTCHRFVFPCRTSPSLTSFSGCGHGWLFPVCAHRWFFKKMCLSLTFFWQPAQVRRWFLFQVALVANFFQVEPVADFIASSHESVADFFFILRRSLTFFTGRARCFFNSCCAHRRLFPRSRQSLTFP